MTLVEFGAAYAFLLPEDKAAFTPFDEEEIAVLEEVRARKRKEWPQESKTY